jgi:hypothetical protein
MESEEAVVYSWRCGGCESKENREKGMGKKDQATRDGKEKSVGAGTHLIGSRNGADASG